MLGKRIFEEVIGKCFDFDVGYILRIPKEALSYILILNIQVDLS